ncbi:MAG: ferritin family protein [Bacteriovoracaceae bacterium]|nr:ferritin family protein [Bacteriovoracaceae bacterium]
MKNEKAMEILKSAILLEKRGEVFYFNVANQAKDQAVKDFFMEMANDEKEHVKALRAQFVHYKNTGSFDANINTELVNQVSEEVLDPTLKDKISAAGYEAAALSAAIDFEKKAVDLYGSRAIEATDPEEKKLFKWLSTWEQGHLDQLVTLDAELREKVWDDNNFWPMD